MTKKNNTINVPISVPQEKQDDFIQNHQAITKNSNRLFLFAADQKIEHLHEDFYGPDLPQELNNPDYLFKLATSQHIGAFATHLGLITRYAKQYPDINYIAKLNAKTPLVTTDQQEPVSNQLWTMDDVLDIQKSGVSIRGVGYTVYLGSEYETLMLHEAAQMIHKAHRAGLVAILWVYPRGQAVEDEQDGLLSVGASGVAASLGADFVKIKPPFPDDIHSEAEWVNIAQQAAGTTKVICSGQEYTDAEAFLKNLYEQLHTGNTGGAAIGRNIFQRPQQEVEHFMHAAATLIYENGSLEDALQIMGKK